MLKRSLMIGMGALLLAGLTATMADAGEARKRKGKVVVEDEDQRKVRRPTRTPKTRTPATHRGPSRREEVRTTRGTTRRPTHRPTVMHPGRRAPNRLHARPLPHPAYRRPALQWVEGRYEMRVRRVWVPGYYRTEKVPARYAVRKGYLGLLWRVRIERECTKKVWVSGHYRHQRERVWVPGYWIRATHPHGRHVTRR